jgi:hypothetical protein
VHYGYLQGKPAPATNQNPSEMSLEQMMQETPISDSMNQ